MPESEPTIASRKAAIRAEVRRRRAARTAVELDAAGAALAGHAAALVGVTIAAFVGTGGEVPTLPLLDALRGRGARVLLPVLEPDDDLDWSVYHGSGALVTGRRGTLEPAATRLGRNAIGTADLVLAPAIAVDRHGRRLGQGGGSYDRALGRTTARIVAVVLDDEVLDEVPAEPHDRPVDGALTPVGGLSWIACA